MGIGKVALSQNEAIADHGQPEPLVDLSSAEITVGRFGRTKWSFWPNQANAAN